MCLCERSRGGLALSLRMSLRLLHLLGFFFWVEGVCYWVEWLGLILRGGCC